MFRKRQNIILLILLAASVVVGIPITVHLLWKSDYVFWLVFNVPVIACVVCLIFINRMEIQMSAHGRKAILVGLSLFLLLPTVLRVNGAFIERRFMIPYRQAVAAGSSEESVRTKFGRPYQSVNKVEVNDYIKEFPPRSQLRLDPVGNILVYLVDPWNDGEGVVLYMLFDKKDRLYQAELGL